MPPSDLSGYAAALTRGANADSGLVDLYGKPLPSSQQFRSPLDFGPGIPMAPRISAEGFPPRITQYTPGWNLITTPRQEDGRSASFQQLRAWCDGAPQVGLCVRWIKAQILGRKWRIVPKDDPKDPRLAREKKADIDRVTAFFRVPNKEDNLPFTAWLGQLLHEMLTVDAAVVYKQRLMDGTLDSLVQIDGAYIKPLTDPQFHVIGYQQVLYGYPAANYGYDPKRVTVVGEYDRESIGRYISYLVANPRVDSPYGTAPIEEILPQVQLSIQRQAQQLAWYTDGAVPDFFIEQPAGWGPDQVAEYFRAVRNELAGDPKSRMKGFPLPPGGKYINTKGFAFNKDESEDLNAFIYAHFGVPQTLARQTTNRATADNQKADAIERSVLPLVAIVEEFLTGVTNADLDAPDLQFVLSDEAEGGIARRDADRADVVAGILTVTEVRKERGLEELPEDAAPAVPLPAPVVPPPPADGTPAEKAELAAWQKVAERRFGKPSWSRAIEFEPTAIGAARSTAIRKALSEARSEADVLAAFAKGSPRRAKAVERVKKLTAKYLDFERERVAKIAETLLAGNEEKDVA